MAPGHRGGRTAGRPPVAGRAYRPWPPRAARPRRRAGRPRPGEPAGWPYRPGAGSAPLAGRSNREIAAELFIAPKTASVHVSNILGKLHAATRTEAAAIAHAEGIDL